MIANQPLIGKIKKNNIYLCQVSTKKTQNKELSKVSRLNKGDGLRMSTLGFWKL